MLHNKKAVVGETLTWVVATLVVIVILVFSIFVTSLLAKGGEILGEHKELSSREEKDLLATKSLTGYLLTTGDSGEKVFEQLRGKGDSQETWKLFDESNGNLAKDIFLKLYGDDYKLDVIWLGIWDARPGRGAERNIPFGTPAESIVGGDQNWKRTRAPTASEIIKFDETRWFVLLLIN